MSVGAIPVGREVVTPYKCHGPMGGGGKIRNGLLAKSLGQ